MIYLDIEADNPNWSAEPDPMTDRAVSICLVEVASLWLDSDFAEPRSRSRLVNPGFALTRTDIHGITSDHVKECPSFRNVAQDLIGIVAKHEVIVTYNGNRYDVPLLWCEFNRSGIEWDTGEHKFIDLAALWAKAEPRKLGDAVKRFLGRDHEGAHTAEADAGVLGELLPKMLDLAVASGVVPEGANLEEVEKLCRRTVKIARQEWPIADLGGHLAWMENELVYTAHRVRGVSVLDDAGFGSWLLRQDFVGPDTKRIIKRTLQEGQPPARRIA